MRQAVTADPVVLADTQTDVVYAIQNTSEQVRGRTVYCVAAADTPDKAEKHLIRDLRWIYMLAEAGESIYVWRDRTWPDEDGEVTYREAL